MKFSHSSVALPQRMCAASWGGIILFSLFPTHTHILVSYCLLNVSGSLKSEIFHRQRIEALGLNLCRCTYAPRFYKLCLLASNKFFLLLIFFPWSLLSAQGSKELNKNIFAVIFSFIATFFAPQICPFVLVVFSTISIFTRYFKRYLFSEQQKKNRIEKSIRDNRMRGKWTDGCRIFCFSSSFFWCVYAHFRCTLRQGRCGALNARWRRIGALEHKARMLHSISIRYNIKRCASWIRKNSDRID